MDSCICQRVGCKNKVTTTYEVTSYAGKEVTHVRGVAICDGCIELMSPPKKENVLKRFFRWLKWLK